MSDTPDRPVDRPTRSIELSVEVAGTPEEVWDAIATGPGVTSWFVPSRVEPAEGGEIALDFGTFGTESAVVTAWEPPHRFAYEGRGGIAYEWLVEARDGSACVVRLVNSGFGHGQDWDDQFDGMSEGWTIFLQSLRLHLARHRGDRGRAFTRSVTLRGSHEAAWATLCTDLGIPTDLAAGDPVRTGDGTPPLDARVETVIARPGATTYLLAVDGPAPGTGFVSAEGSGPEVACSLHLYLYGDAVDAAGQPWMDWLGTRHPATTGASVPAPAAEPS